MSFILSCDFWFCCGRANDDPADRYQPPPPPASQTQMVAVVQAPPVQQQPPHHVPSHHHQMPPLAPVAMGPAMPPHQASPWPHVPPTRSYDPPQLPVSSPAPAPPTPTTMVHDPRVSPRAVPPRRVPSKSHDPFLPPADETPTAARVPLPCTKAHDPSPPKQNPAAQVPWSPARQPSKATGIQLQAVPPARNKVPSKRYDETPAPAVAPTTQTPPRATSGVYHDPSPQSAQMHGSFSIVCRLPSTMKAHDPPPAPSSQRPPETAWPTRHPSKTYQTKPVSYDTPDPLAVVLGAEDLLPAASIAPREPLNHYI